MDEQPVQSIRETREALPPTREHPERVVCEFERAGTVAVFILCEPLGGLREAIA